MLAVVFIHVRGDGGTEGRMIDGWMEECRRMTAAAVACCAHLERDGRKRERKRRMKLMDGGKEDDCRMKEGGARMNECRHTAIYLRFTADTSLCMCVRPACTH